VRICLYTETALPRIGGQELVVDALARRFLARRHDVVVLTPCQRHAPHPDDSRLPYPVLRHWRLISARRMLDMYCWSLARVYWQYRFDVLHCHNVYPAGYIAARWARWARVPLVITSHNGDIFPSSPMLRKPGVPRRVAYVLGRADRVVAISPSMARRLRELCAGPCRIQRIANGVELACLARRVERPVGLPPGIQPQRYFLSLGRLVHQKGVDLLLRAFAAVCARNDLRLVIAGRGPCEQALRAQAASLELAERVHFVGWAEGTTKVYLLQNAISTVMPSRETEGLPLALLESYAAGTPVIGTRIPGLEEVIEPNQTGLLVPPESALDLAEATTVLARDPSKARCLGGGAQRAAQDYDWSRIADRHLELYQTLIAARAGHQALVAS